MTKVDERPACADCGERTDEWNLSWRGYCSDCELEAQEDDR